MAMKQSVRWLALLCVAGVLSTASAQLRRRINPSECFVGSSVPMCVSVCLSLQTSPSPSSLALRFLAGAGQLIM